MCCLMAKEHAVNMETPSAGALLFVTFNKRSFFRVRRVVLTVNEFVRLYLSHDSYLIRFVANYTVVQARSQSFLGHNVLFCAHHYNYLYVNICNSLVRLII